MSYCTKNIFAEHRRKMEPHLLEMLLFLKVNKRFWLDKTIYEACRLVNSNVATVATTNED